MMAAEWLERLAAGVMNRTLALDGEGFAFNIWHYHKWPEYSHGLVLDGCESHCFLEWKTMQANHRLFKK